MWLKKSDRNYYYSLHTDFFQLNKILFSIAYFLQVLNIRFNILTLSVALPQNINFPFSQ